MTYQEELFSFDLFGCCCGDLLRSGGFSDLDTHVVERIKYATHGALRGRENQIYKSRRSVRSREQNIRVSTLDAVSDALRGRENKINNSRRSPL